MDIAKFELVARDPRRTRADLETMRKHALDKGEVEFAAIANEVINTRFDEQVKRGGGSTPTTVRLLNSVHNFDSGIQAYLWLVDRFESHSLGTLARYVALHYRGSKSRKGCRFAKTPSDLFPVDSTRRQNPAFYAKLACGWFADTNLSHDDKFSTLVQLAYMCDLEYEEHWNFIVTGATEELQKRQIAISHSKELLDELLWS